MNESEFQQLLEASWRRKLSAAEELRLQSHLAEHPEAPTDWESEVGLNHLLDQLPKAPLSSNFTARVMQAVDRETAAARRFAPFDWLKQLAQRPALRLAWAAVFVALGVLAVVQYETLRQEKSKIADGLVRLAHVAATADPKVFEDFETIRRVRPGTASPDDALFVVLSQNP